MSHLKALAALVGVLAFVAFGAWVGNNFRAALDARELREAEEAIAALKLQGFQEGEVTKPEVPDLPKGAEAVAVVKGSVGFTVRRGISISSASHGVPKLQTDHAPGAEKTGPAEAAPAAETASDSAPGASVLPSWPAPGDLAVRSEARLVKVQGKPFAQLWLSCDLQGPEGGVLTTRGPELADTIALQVAPAAVQQAARWHGEIRAGLSSAGGWEAGGSFYGRSRLGGWVSAGAGYGAAGVALRLGR